MRFRAFFVSMSVVLMKGMSLVLANSCSSFVVSGLVAVSARVKKRLTTLFGSLFSSSRRRSE